MLIKANFAKSCIFNIYNLYSNLFDLSSCGKTNLLIEVKIYTNIFEIIQSQQIQVCAAKNKHDSQLLSVFSGVSGCVPVVT
jgi:hypothetical protein